jgi:hypothetical protein
MPSRTPSAAATNAAPTLLDVENQIGTAECFVRAAYMAASDLGDAEMTDAIQIVADQALKELEKACSMLQAVRERAS